MTGAGEAGWSRAAAAYDAIAARYDLIPIENRINRYMRNRSLERLRSTFRAGHRVLEIGCGTGTEALDLARRGVEVVALDPSGEMIRLARSSAESQDLARRATFVQGAARDISTMLGPAQESFDGGYASFSLAYEPDLAPVARGLRGVLKPGAPFLASLPSRVCLVELLLAFASGRPSLAGRRLRPYHNHKVGSHLVPIRTYTPRSFAEAIAPHLVLARVEALPAIVPPPHHNRWYTRLNDVADAIEQLDKWLRTRFPFRFLGDHFLAELHRVSSPP